jgi:DNA polymerase-3 subunit delta
MRDRRGAADRAQPRRGDAPGAELMPLRPQDLARDLERELKPVYLVSGDELLLVQEACDRIIEAARVNGFTERTIVQVETAFRWPELTAEANSLSLFAPRRLLDVRVPAKRLDKDAADALLEYLDNPAPETLLLLRTEQLESKQRNAEWFKRIDTIGAVVLAWGVSAKEMPRWIAQRSRRLGLEFERDALDHLADSVEGNLLAAAQEIEKLALLGLPQPVTLEALTAAVTDAAHYDAFDLVDAALAGEARRVRHIVWVLRAEGVAVLSVLGALASQVRRLLNDDSRGLPQTKERAMRAARERLESRELEGLLEECARVDRQVKGAAPGDPWRTLECVALRLAGVPSLASLAER